MDSKTLNQFCKNNSQLDISEEDLNKKSKDTQKQKNKNSNNQQSSSTVLKRNSIRIPLLTQENLISNSRIYQEYIKIYHEFSCFYSISNIRHKKKIYKLVIYDTKSKTEKKIVIDQHKKIITDNTCIAQLPNGGLFCFGTRSKKTQKNTFLIDRDFHAHQLPPERYCYNSSAIYYNRSIYCFGGKDYSCSKHFNFSNRFDLDLNRWIKLSPIPKNAENCNTVIFNGNILISSPKNVNIWIYAVDIDSFSIIPYEFRCQTTKIMTNTGKRLYLIESNKHWIIYKSKFGDEFSWEIVLSLKNIITIHGEACSSLYNKEKERFIF